MKAVIIAGGEATRLRPLTEKTAKSAVDINGMPVICHHLNVLRENNIMEVIVLGGRLSDQVFDCINNADYDDMSIRLHKEKKPMGTAGSVLELKDFLDDDFIVIYGDILFNLDFSRLIEFHREKKGIGTLVLHPNDHPYDSDLVDVENDSKIVDFFPKPHDPGKYYRNLVSAALYVLSPKILDYLEEGVKLDWGRDIFPILYEKEQLFGYITPEYVKDMGTPERLIQVREDFRSGKFYEMNLKNKRSAIFLDRDGTINGDMNNTAVLNDFELLPKAAEAVRLINKSKYIAIVITNQPGIAKGFFNEKQLDKIHNKMETLLGEKGAFLDRIFYCPHHPQKGYSGEVEELKIDCDCRKPNAGMIFKAAEVFNIDLKNSWIIGDSERDIKAGEKAGIKTVQVKRDLVEYTDCKTPDFQAESLYLAVKYILSDDNHKNSF